VRFTNEADSVEAAESPLCQILFFGLKRFKGLKSQFCFESRFGESLGD
jgi:hypothetical protein